MATRQEPEVRAWWLKKSEEEGPSLPGMTQRYLELEAAILFGMGLEEFLSRPAQRRAEMMAHVLIRKQREVYADAMMEEWREKKKKTKGKYNPIEAQRRRWMVGEVGKAKG